LNKWIDVWNIKKYSISWESLRLCFILGSSIGDNICLNALGPTIIPLVYLSYLLDANIGNERNLRERMDTTISCKVEVNHESKRKENARDSFVWWEPFRNCIS
jgi:hypothetical protein